MHSINLIPQTVIQRFERKRLIRIWSKVLLFVLVVSLLSVAWGQTTADHMRRLAEQQQHHAQYPQRVRHQHAALKSKLTSLKQYEDRQNELRSPYSPLTVMSMLHQLKEDLGGQLQANSVEFADQSPGPSTAPGAAIQSSNGYVTLQLVANGSITCSDLMQRIRELQLFNKVILSSPLELVDASDDALRFTLRCEF